VRDNLQVKQVRIAEDERFIICYNPEQADRDRALREVMTGKLTALIADTDRLTPTKRAEQVTPQIPCPGRLSAAEPGPVLLVWPEPAPSVASIPPPPPHHPPP
jgi:hypothetical protein